MSSTASPAPSGWRRIFAWPRLRFTLAVSGAFGLLSGIGNEAPFPIDLLRAFFVGCAILLMFGWLERWPRELPRWLPRTALRLIGIVLVIPISSAFVGEDDFRNFFFAALMFAPWIAVAAILRQRDDKAREQAHQFELERSEFERREADARLKLMQAQVEPHFLFNTLANVQALVDSGSPQASKVLNNLIAYLRAAVPRMQSQSATIAEEVELVRAYLELMQMRMPDRLQYAIHLDPEAARQYCPPMTLLTLIENAVRHGIDPSETGGRIDAFIRVLGNRCEIRVTDTGVGLEGDSRGLGTGLSTLRERLRLAFGGDAHLTLTGIRPHGVSAEISLPLREAT